MGVKGTPEPQTPATLDNVGTRGSAAPVGTRGSAAPYQGAGASEATRQVPYGDADAAFGGQPTLRVALYLRVSTTNGQETDNQRRQLKQFGRSQGWVIQCEYEDHESGSRSDRIEFRRLMQDAATRRWDLLLFWALDRFTREGTLATLKYLELLEGYGVRWRSFTEPWIDSAGPFRDVVISLLASLAKQERVRISQRVRAGLERAKATGTRSGRPIGRPRAVFDRNLAIELRRQGASWSHIARKLGTSVASVRRACADAEVCKQ